VTATENTWPVNYVIFKKIMLTYVMWNLHNFNISQSTKIRYRSAKRVPIEVSVLQIIRTCELKYKKKAMHKAHSQMKHHIILISFISTHIHIVVCQNQGRKSRNRDFRIERAERWLIWLPEDWGDSSAPCLRSWLKYTTKWCF
jgi:hypothetical protein